MVDSGYHSRREIILMSESTVKRNCQCLFSNPALSKQMDVIQIIFKVTLSQHHCPVNDID